MTILFAIVMMLLMYFLNAIIALKSAADIKQTNDESKNGSTVNNIDFAIVDTEPKRAAAMSAAVKPMPWDFVKPCGVDKL